MKLGLYNKEEKRGARGEQHPSDFCPVTGFPITRKPDWTDISFGKDYRITLSILGSNILIVQPSGYGTLHDVEKVVPLINRVVREGIGEDKRFVHVSDYSKVRGVSFEARKYFIEHMKGRDQVIAMIHYGLSAISGLSVKLAKRLNIIKFNVEIAEDYADAVDRAVKWLAKTEPPPNPASSSLEIIENINLIEYEADNCPVTGLPIINHPEWTNIQVGEKSTATFQVIGNRILHSTLNGNFKNEVGKNFQRKRSEFIKAEIGAGEPFFELRDFSALRGRISKETERILTNGADVADERILGMIAYNSPIPIKLSANWESNLSAPRYPRLIVPDYESAIKKALETLMLDGHRKETAPPGVITNQDWSLDFNGFSIGYELIDEDIVHAILRGYLQEEHIPPTLKLSEKIISSVESSDQSYYFVTNMTALMGASRKARKRYFEGLKNRYENRPFKALIHYGSNRFLRAVIGLLKPTAPFKTIGVDSLESALELVGEMKTDRSADVIPSAGPSEGVDEPSDEIQKYLQELITFIGSINWESDGFDLKGMVDPSHPFRAVFDAIALIKTDLDDVIHDQRKTQEAFIQSEAKYQTILESIDDGYYEVDLNGNIRFFNDSLCKITGYTTEEMMDMNFRQCMDEKDSGKVEDAFKKVNLTGGYSTAIDWELIRKDGSKAFVESSVSFIKDSENIPGGFRGIVRDVTLRKRSEVELKRAKDYAVSANKSKSDFLANMSHEIRTPMNAVIGFTDMLLDSALDQSQKDYVMTLKRSGEDLLSIINTILDFSKIEAGDLEMEEIDFDPELVAHDVCDLIRPRLERRDVEILCRIGDDVPSNIIGDPLRFRQVLTNLMGNACKFTESGEIELSLSIREEKDDEIELHAAVRDTGIGIAQEKLDTIFEAFHQADGSTTRKFGGTGLGLSICRQLSMLMNGELWVESDLGKGSTFHFTAWVKKGQETTPKGSGQVDLSGKSVLIVDDNETNLEVLKHVLESVGMSAVALTKSTEVLQTLEKNSDNGNPFDFCLTDIQMPNMDGLELAKQIRDPGGPFENLPLIALSSLMDRDARKCESVGFNGFLSKPVKTQRLLQMMESMLRDHEEEDFEKPEKRIVTQYSVREEAKHSVGILLVEDNAVNQKLAEILLKKAGYQVVVANNGAEAIEIYSKSPDEYDLIFMDVQMPIMDGIQATEKMRENGFKDVPIIALTAHAVKGDKEKCLEAGMDDYVTKPIKREIVLEKIKKWVLKE